MMMLGKEGDAMPMLDVETFMAVVAAERKRDERGEELTPDEQALLSRIGSKPKLCGCGCGKPLEPRIDGERHQMGGVEVNSDCYFDSFGDALEVTEGLPQKGGFVFLAGPPPRGFRGR